MGRLARLVPSLGYGRCLHCRRPWWCARSHVTRYSTHRGMFPLCERCWTDLATADARLPYYGTLWDRWRYDRDGWEAIECAVRLGG